MKKMVWMSVSLYSEIEQFAALISLIVIIPCDATAGEMYEDTIIRDKVILDNVCMIPNEVLNGTNDPRKGAP